MSEEKTAMIEILSSILSRLVNVALCLVITSIALLRLRNGTDLHLGIVVALAVVIGVLGTIAVRWVLRLLHRLWRKVFDSFAR